MYYYILSKYFYIIDTSLGGGHVSTIPDLSTFFHAILSQNETLLPRRTIDSWLNSAALLEPLICQHNLDLVVNRAD